MPSSHPNNYSLARTFSSLLVVASLVLSSARGGAIENACADDDAGSSNAGGGGRRRRPDSAVSELLDWLRENGAHVSPKVAVGRVDPDDPNSPRGVFAVDDMDEGETVCVIPWDLMIVPDLVIDPMVDDDCGTIHAVYDAMSEGGKTPYAKYLLDQPVDYLPSFWSQVSERVCSMMMSRVRRFALRVDFPNINAHTTNNEIAYILMTLQSLPHRLLETYCRTCCVLRGQIHLRNPTSSHVSILYFHHPFPTWMSLIKA